MRNVYNFNVLIYLILQLHTWSKLLWLVLSMMSSSFDARMKQPFGCRVTQRVFGIVSFDSCSYALIPDHVVERVTADWLNRIPAFVCLLQQWL